MPVERAEPAPAAAELLGTLTALHGPVTVHRSGGCGGGSAPMCHPRGEYRVGAADVLPARPPVGDTPFRRSADPYAYRRHTLPTVDVVPGRGSGFSPEAPEGVRLLIRSRLFTDARSAAPPTGADTR
jgi:uncharacterized protein (DUF779 family)